MPWRFKLVFLRCNVSHQSLSKVANFAMMARMSPVALALGRTDLIMSPQSLSVNTPIPNVVSFFSRATCALTLRFPCRFNLPCMFCLIHCNSFCAWSATWAFPILEPQTFHNTEAENAPFYASNCWTCSSSSSSLWRGHVGHTTGIVATIKDTFIQAATKQVRRTERADSLCLNSCLTFLLARQIWVNRTKPIV